MATVLFLPVLVEVNQNVDAAVEIELGVVVEIGVNAELSTRLDLVEASADKVGIGDHALDTGEHFEKLEHGTAVQEEENIAVALRQPFDAIESQLLFIGIIKLLPLQFFRLGKISQCCLGSLYR
jgi:hypothetical protein